MKRYCVQFDHWDGASRRMIDFDSSSDAATLVLCDAWRAFMDQRPNDGTALWHITRIWTLPDGERFWTAQAWAGKVPR